MKSVRVDTTTGERLLELAHQVCPDSNATRGNIPVKLTFEEQSLATLE
jgi:osmotically inducible protein OsmC